MTKEKSEECNIASEECIVSLWSRLGESGRGGYEE